MTFISPGTPYDTILGISAFLIILIACTLAFAILSTLLINNKSQANFFIP
jgi:hypothetical protein